MQYVDIYLNFEYVYTYNMYTSLFAETYINTYAGRYCYTCLYSHIDIQAIYIYMYVCCMSVQVSVSDAGRIPGIVG